MKRSNKIEEILISDAKRRQEKFKEVERSKKDLKINCHIKANKNSKYFIIKRFEKDYLY